MTKKQTNMDKQTFTKLCSLTKDSHIVVRKAYEIGIDLIEFCNTETQISELLWKSILTEEGFGWLSWFLYEKAYVDGLKKDMKAYDENKNEICTSVDSLYDFLKQNNHFNTLKK